MQVDVAELVLVGLDFGEERFVEDGWEGAATSRRVKGVDEVVVVQAVVVAVAAAAAAAEAAAACGHRGGGCVSWPPCAGEGAAVVRVVMSEGEIVVAIDGGRRER